MGAPTAPARAESRSFAGMAAHLWFPQMQTIGRLRHATISSQFRAAWSVGRIIHSVYLFFEQSTIVVGEIIPLRSSC